MNETWIWLPAEQYPAAQKARITDFCFDDGLKQTMGVFRKSFELDSIPVKAWATWSGETRFRMFINGAFVEDGPIDVGGDYGCRTACDWYIPDTRDLAPYFHAGKNVISFEVFTLGFAQTDYSCGLPGFFFDMELSFADGTSAHIVSDTSWRCIEDPAGKDFPTTWNAWKGLNDPHSIDFDDSQWYNAGVLPRPERKRLDLDLPPLINTPEKPGSVFYNDRDYQFGDILENLPGVVELHFPGEIAGHFSFTFRTNGKLMVEILYQERKGLPHYTENWLVPAGEHTFRSPRLHAFQFVTIRIKPTGFCKCVASLQDITVYRRGFPISETLPFHCSDPALLKIRHCCDAALRMCMQRLHLDSPVHQEGLGCTGDYMVEARMSYALYGETRLAAADLKRTAYFILQHNAKMFHASYTLLFVKMLRDYYMETGDLDTVKFCYEAVEKVIDYFTGYMGEEGLLSQGRNYMFIDWVDFEGITFSFHHPPASMAMGVFSAFFVKALATAGEFAERLGKPDDVERFRKIRETVVNAIEKHLWDDEAQCYRDGIPGINVHQKDGWPEPDPDHNTYSPQTAVALLATGVVPVERQDELFRKIMSGEFPYGINMYFSHFLFEAMRICGKFSKYGLAWLRRWIPAAEEHPSGLKEAWHGGGDFSHAWGGTPAVQFKEQILGVTPLTPGYGKVRIAPCPGDLSCISGTVRTVKGDITISCADGILDVQTPAGMETEIIPPPGVRLK